MQGFKTQEGEPMKKRTFSPEKEKRLQTIIGLITAIVNLISTLIAAFANK